MDDEELRPLSLLATYTDHKTIHFIRTIECGLRSGVPQVEQAITLPHHLFIRKSGIILKERGRGTRRGCRIPVREPPRPGPHFKEHFLHNFLPSEKSPRNGAHFTPLAVVFRTKLFRKK